MSSQVISINHAPEMTQPVLPETNNWVQNYPTALKVAKFALLIVGIGLLISTPFLAPLLKLGTVLLVTAGVISLIASYALFQMQPSSKPAIVSSSSEAPAQPQLPDSDQVRISLPLTPGAPSQPLVPPASAPPSPQALQSALAAPLPQAAPAPTQAAPSKPDYSRIDPLDRPWMPLWEKLEAKTNHSVACLEKDKEVVQRFLNIPCPRATAIEVGGKYIHANHVGLGRMERRCIATQAPLERDYEAFWQLLFEREATVVDLTTLDDVDNGGVTKYYPEVGQQLSYGNVQVKGLTKTGNTRSFEVEIGGVKKMIHRYRYPHWNDGEAVLLENFTGLLGAVKELANDPQKPLVVHCRAGVGRSGTFITAFALEEEIRAGKITKDNLDEALTNLIALFRTDRGPIFVQKPRHLGLLHTYAMHLLKEQPEANAQ